MTAELFRPKRVGWADPTKAAPTRSQPRTSSERSEALDVLDSLLIAPVSAKKPVATFSPGALCEDNDFAAGAVFLHTSMRLNDLVELKDFADAYIQFLGFNLLNEFLQRGADEVVPTHSFRLENHTAVLM